MNPNACQVLTLALDLDLFLYPWTGLVRILDAADGTVIADFDGHPDRVDAVAFSPDGSLLASADESGVVKVWGSR